VRGRKDISVHRLVQETVLSRLARDPKAFQEAFQEASNIVQMQLPPSSRIQVPQPGAGYKYKKYMTQIMSLSTRSQTLPLDNPSLDFAQLISDTGTFMCQNGLFLESEALINTGMDVLERSHVNNSELLSDLHILLGTIGDHVGVSHREMSLRHRAKALGLRRYGCHATESGGLTRLYDIRLWSAEAEYGCALLQEQRFTEAEALFDRCLMRYKSWGSEEEFPFEYAKYHSYMAFVRTSQGRFEEAIKLATHACNLQLMHEGPQSLLFLLYRFALANQCFYAGNHQHALDIHLNVLEFRRKLCGEHNPLTLESYSVIGAVLHAQNRHEESR
jgi:tetratricopeptide (TPR) repeat protein